MLDYSTAVLDYDRFAHPLASVVENHFQKHLAYLHCSLREGGEIPRLQVGKDQGTPFHQKFYAIGEEFHGLYRGFVRFVLGDDAPDCLFQRIPTFRVHLPGNVATGGFHKDADYNHAREELNYHVPLTRAVETSAIWLESEENKGDYKPMNLEVGQYLRFHGAVLTHGSHPNETGRTRVSIDFRVLPKAAYVDDGRKTINQGVGLRLGEYWADGAEVAG